jgi:hypothetical protein
MVKLNSRAAHSRAALGCLAVVLLLAGCASAQQAKNDDDAPQIELLQGFTGAETLFFRGPVPLTYQLKIHNPLDVPVTLRRLELRTQGTGAYQLRAEAPNLGKTIPPGGDEVIELYTWGQSRGGFLSGGEPVTLIGTALFDTPNGAKSRIFTEYLPQPG